MLTVEISLPEVEELQKLVQEGLEKGVLTYDEIATGLDDAELTKEQVEDFYTYLIDHGVELLEGETHKHPPHEQLQTPEEEKGPKLDLRDLVDPPGGHARDRGQGADDSHPRAHGREAEQGRAHRAPARAASRARAAPGRDRRGARDDDRGGAGDPAHVAASDLAREA